MRQMQATTHPALYNKRWHEDVVVGFVVAVFFTLIDRASTHTQKYEWLLIRYVVWWTEKDQRDTHKASTREIKNTNKHKTKTTKIKEQ